MDVLILTGDRDSLQLVTERSTVLYPMRGVSDLARMTPGGGRGPSTACRPSATPSSPRSSGRPPTTCPGVPGVGQGFAAKWINTYDGLDNVITHADKITGKKGEALREHLGDVMRNRRLNALVRDLDLELRPGRPGAAALGPPGGAHPLRRPGVPGAARPALRDPDVRGGRRRRRLRARRGPVSRPARLSAWLAEHAGRAGSACTVQGTWRAGTGEVDSLALAAEDGTAAWFDAAELDPRRRRRAGGLARRPRAAQGAPRRQGPDAGAGAPAAGRWTGLQSDTALAAYLVRPDQRSYDLADLTLRYLKRELKQGGGDDGQLSLDSLDAGLDSGRGRRRLRRATAMLHARAVLDLAEALDERRRRARRHRSCSPRSSCRWSPAGPHGAHRHRRRRRPPRGAGVALRRRGRARPRRRRTR